MPKLNACLKSLSQQDNAPEFEVLIGIDGGSTDAQESRVEIPSNLRGSVRIQSFDKVGYIPVRSCLLQQASGDVVLSLNDDVLASSCLLRAHLDVHSSYESVVVTGPAPFVTVGDLNLFDRLVAESSMIFFNPESMHSTNSFEVDYRNCFGLNMSYNRQVANEIGGIPALQDVYGYDDIELAWRFAHSTDSRIVFNRSASVQHDHRFEPHDLFKREYDLGRAAHAWAGSNHAFCEELFRRDIRASGFVSSCQSSIMLEFDDAKRMEPHVLALSERDADGVQAELLPTLALGWTTLKRFLWRWGYVDAVKGVPNRWSLLDALTSPPTY